jgi:arylsulfatase A-like enzyme
MGDLLTQSVSHRGEREYAMKRGLRLVLPAVLALLMIPFVTLSYAAIGDYDLSSPKDGDVDGKDLASWIATPGPDIAGFAGAFGQTYTVSTRKPNILLIIADDVGLDMTTDMYPGLIDSLEAKYGSGVRGRPASTPVLDQLAQQGMRFSNAWAHPFCSPTRAAIITGMYAAKTNVDAYDEPMSTSHTTFVQRLKGEANYSTAIFGKWHLAGGWSGYNDAMPKRMGFDIFEGHLDSAIPNYWNYKYQWQNENTPVSQIEESATPPPRTLPGIAETTFEPVVRAADTIEWINARQAQNPDKPWFVWLAFNQAHVAVSGSGGSVPLYHVPNADTMNQTTRDEILGCGGVPGSSYNAGQISCTPAQFMRAMTNSMDTVIGKVLQAVASIPSDTYVIFIGDNGTWSTVMDNMYITKAGRGKTTPYESGARVPMVIRGPGITAGSQSSEFVHAVDLFSTCLLLAGLEVAPEGLVYRDYQGNPAALDGVSLTPILFSSASTIRDPNEGYLLTEVAWSGNKVGARNGTYKVICNTSTSGTCYFYNLVTDPVEEYPLSKPTSCTNFRTWPFTDPNWHYCRLIEVMNLYSIFP